MVSQRQYCTSCRGWIAAAIALVLSATLVAQTQITPPPNEYSPQQDVQLGQQAAAEAG
jgi:hypothetical protein